MDTARNLCANGVKGGETNTDHADPSQNRTPRSIDLSSLTLRTAPETARFQNNHLTGRSSTDLSIFPVRICCFTHDAVDGLRPEM
jgi:hypothetical protein